MKYLAYILTVAVYCYTISVMNAMTTMCCVFARQTCFKTLTDVLKYYSFRHTLNTSYRPPYSRLFDTI